MDSRILFPVEEAWVGEELVILRDLPEGSPAAWSRLLESSALPGLVEAVAAWDTVGLYVVPGQFRLESAVQLLEGPPPSEVLGTLHSIPVCYELGEDLDEAAGFCGLEPEELIQRHSSQPYPCRAVGFCPGFAYLGPLPSPLDLIPRRGQPRTRVEPGSVAAAAGQTGVYPLPRPGGWMILGHTPLTLVDEETEWRPIVAGDLVQFRPIGLEEHRRLKGMRLGEAL